MNRKATPLIFAAAFICCAATSVLADLKLKTRTTVAGHATEGATYIKGQRQRSSQNFGNFEMVTITQCDLKRTVQINDNAKTYMITPIDESTPTQETGPREPSRESQPSRTRRGGVVTYTTTIADTGERKKMFGYTARHITTRMTAESSPDACNQTKMRMETDGWYIDFEFSFDCNLDRPPVSAFRGRGPKPDCQDEVRMKRTGSAKLGYPVSLTTTIYGEDGQTTTMTTEVLELSAATLDAALFDIPEGYTEAKDFQQLMGIPSMESIRRGQVPTQPREEMAARAGTKQPGALRVGVVNITGKTDRSVQAGLVRERLISGITGSNIDAVPLDSTSPADIEAEAKQKSCDFILYTDVGELKKSGKVGGLLGRATGVGGLNEKYESRLDFKLFAVGSSTPRLASSAAAKEDGSAEVSLSAAAGKEASAVLAEVSRK